MPAAKKPFDSNALINGIIGLIVLGAVGFVGSQLMGALSKVDENNKQIIEVQSDVKHLVSDVSGLSATNPLILQKLTELDTKVKILMGDRK
jgi:hypothetical protein